MSDITHFTAYKVIKRRLIVPPHPDDYLVHTACGNNVKPKNTTTNPALVNCSQCMRSIAKRDREAGKLPGEDQGLDLTNKVSQAKCHDGERIALEVSHTEFCAILAGLRLLQTTRQARQTLDPDIYAIYSDGDTIVPLIATEPFKQQDEFDRLCERLNSTGERHGTSQ